MQTIPSLEIPACFMQPDAKRAIDVIKYGVITVTPQTRLYQALACIVDLNISGLPVVDKSMHLQGIITEKDLLAMLYEKQTTSGLVESYMHREVVSFPAETLLEEICNCLIQNPFRRVPITHRGKVVSVISRTDLVRVNVHKFLPEQEPAPKPPFPARQLMIKGLITVRPESSLGEALSLMADYSISGLPVVEEGMYLVGIITEKDLMPYFYSQTIPPARVGEIMTTDVTVFSPESSVFEITECLIHNNFRRVPIVKDGVLVGLVSRADVIRYILRNLTRISHYRAVQKVNQLIP
ncbi:MAG TPA: CBS domain-containing protein [Anaerohalosphaeraceae bacterium]|nr:CBS domain-containing protein [Anaerohalosphaeraceae bacterium]HOL88042.1 CBS domain-containing protein [Anaerohalosphaeraceae bacterium]HPP55290.1 CBS domain-containing protein [Anaerohalosphaeraceae bacterium]